MFGVSGQSRLAPFLDDAGRVSRPPGIPCMSVSCRPFRLQLMISAPDTSQCSQTVVHISYLFTFSIFSTLYHGLLPFSAFRFPHHFVCFLRSDLRRDDRSVELCSLFYHFIFRFISHFLLAHLVQLLFSMSLNKQMSMRAYRNLHRTCGAEDPSDANPMECATSASCQIHDALFTSFRSSLGLSSVLAPLRASCLHSLPSRVIVPVLMTARAYDADLPSYLKDRRFRFMHVDGSRPVKVDAHFGGAKRTLWERATSVGRCSHSKWRSTDEC